MTEMPLFPFPAFLKQVISAWKFDWTEWKKGPGKLHDKENKQITYIINNLQLQHGSLIKDCQKNE